jgi:hypothetical protein
MDAAQVCTIFKTYAGGHIKWLPEMSQTTIKMKAAFNLHKNDMETAHNCTNCDMSCLK